MQEYKREKTTLESRIKDLSKKMAYNDEHVSVLDAWLKQVFPTHLPSVDVCLRLSVLK